MSNPIYVGDLTGQTGMTGPRPILHCTVCGTENSANLDDYFNLPEHHIFKCCDENMELVIKRVVYEHVSTLRVGDEVWYTDPHAQRTKLRGQTGFIRSIDKPSKKARVEFTNMSSKPSHDLLLEHLRRKT